MKSRPCPKCGCSDPGSFNRDRSKPDGYQVLCRTCHGQIMKRYRQDPVKKAEQRTRWRAWYHRHKQRPSNAA